MEIKWLGETTFLIKSSTGKRILINPIKLNSYITNYEFQPDLITLSNSQYIYKTNSNLKTDCKIIDCCNNYKNEYISIEGYNTYSDDIKGLKRGENTIFVFEIDNLKFCHLGTLGHNLENSLISKLKNLDFLFVPIGGHFSLNGLDAAILSNNIKPKYIIPMLYKTSLQNSYLDGPYKFISHMKNIAKFNNSKIQTSELSFNNNNSVLMLTP